MRKVGLIIWLLMCVSCTFYTGDGRLTDHGPFSTERYVLDLGSINLAQIGQETFRLAGLPAKDFVFGLDVGTAQESRCVVEEKALRTTVRMELLRNDGTTVFAIESPLERWTWSLSWDDSSKAFVYGRDNPRTELEPMPGQTYALKIGVTDTDESAKLFDARIVGKSGGWK